MADAKEEMPKEKQQRKAMKKGRRKKRQDLRCFFSSLVLQGRRGGRFVASRVEGREGRKGLFAMELCFKRLYIERVFKVYKGFKGYKGYKGFKDFKDSNV